MRKQRANRPLGSIVTEPDEVLLVLYPTKRQAHSRMRQLTREVFWLNGAGEHDAAREVAQCVRVLRDRYGSPPVGKRKGRARMKPT